MTFDSIGLINARIRILPNVAGDLTQLIINGCRMLGYTRVKIKNLSVHRGQWLTSICRLLVLLFLIVFTSNAKAAEKQIEKEVFVIGTGIIIDGNLALAKRAAVSHSLEKGVEKYLLNTLGRQGAINYFQRLIEYILPSAREEIESYHILAEGQVDNEYKILMKIKINQEMMEEKLRQAGLILSSAPALKMLFLVSEKTKDEISYWWKTPHVYSSLSPLELALHNVFQDRGFSPINRALNLPEDGYSDDLRAPELDVQAVLRWGRLFSADVVFYGQADMSDPEEVFLFSKVFDVDQGFMICQEVESLPVQEGREDRDQEVQILKKLVTQLAERVIPAIISTSAAGPNTKNHLKIIISGLNSYKQLITFRDFLRKEVDGVKSVKQTRVRGSSVFLTLDFEGNRDEFLKRVLNHGNLPLLLSHEPSSEEEYILFKIE